MASPLIGCRRLNQILPVVGRIANSRGQLREKPLSRLGLRPLGPCARIPWPSASLGLVDRKWAPLDLREDHPIPFSGERYEPQHASWVHVGYVTEARSRATCTATKASSPLHGGVGPPGAEQDVTGSAAGHEMGDAGDLTDLTPGFWAARALV